MYLPISGMSATRDWICRANSCSTRSRSSRIGSKICARSAVTGRFCAVSVTCTSPGWTSPYRTQHRGVNALSRCFDVSWAEQPYKIASDVRLEVRRRFGADGRQRVEHAADVRRFVALPAVRYGGQIRAVGLDQQPIGRDDGGGLAQVRGFRERHDPGERDVEPDVERAPGHRRVAGKAMEHALDSTCGFQNGK